MSSPSRYEFVTRWEIPAPVEAVWLAMFDPEQWPKWWRGVEKVETISEGIDLLGTGAVRKYTWRSRLPYRIQFTMETILVREFTRIEGVATGELEGKGCWHFSQRQGTTHVRYEWNVVANKRWMIWMAPIAKPMFVWNHDTVMEWGRQGLFKRLGLPDKPRLKKK